jgi:uncharacterized membrane protein YidH (DUF202 family)
MKKQKDLLEGRTKEWNSIDYQGRNKEQVQNNEIIMVASMFLFVVFFIVAVIINALANG